MELTVINQIGERFFFNTIRMFSTVMNSVWHAITDGRLLHATFLKMFQVIRLLPQQN